MAITKRKLVYQRSGQKYFVSLYDRSSDVGSAYMAAAIDSKTHYARLAAVGGADDSYLRVYKGDAQKAVSTFVSTSISCGIGPGIPVVHPTAPYIYIPNHTGNNLTVSNKSTGASIATIACGNMPFGTALNPTTNRLYVSNTLGPSVTVINTTNNTVVTTISLSPRTDPYLVAVNRTTNKIYVASAGTSPGISVIDGSTNTVSASIAASNNCFGVCVNEVDNRFYVGRADGNVLVYNGSTNELITTIATSGLKTQHLGYNPVTKMLYAANYDSGTVSVINVGTNSLVTTVAVGTNPGEMGIDTMTNTIYVCNAGGISVIDGSNNTVLWNIPIPVAACGIAFDDATGLMYYSLTSSNKVLMFNSSCVPLWQWAVKAGGTGMDQGYGSAVDSSGNCYIAGYFNGTATFGTTSLTSAGGYDICVAKLNPSGTWQWAVKVGGAAADAGIGIAADPDGNCYVTGYFSDTVTFGTTTLSSAGGYDIFVAKLNTFGTWQWAVKAGGTGTDPGFGITVDSSGNCYITGHIQNTATFGTTTLTSSGSDDIFAAKLNSSGIWQWAVKAGSVSSDYGYGIAADSNGNCYFAGYFSGTATFGTTQLTSSGNFDVFVAKLNTSGTWQWAVKAGGSALDSALGIAVDSSGNCYVSGYFSGTMTVGATPLTSAGGNDIFVAKLNTSGAWQWAIKIGGTGADAGIGVAADSTGNCYITGYFSGTTTFGTITLTSAGGHDAFVAKLDTSGDLQWAVKAGGTGTDDGYGLAVDSSGNCYVVGYFDGNATFGTTSLASSGNYDIFAAKLELMQAFGYLMGGTLGQTTQYSTGIMSLSLSTLAYTALLAMLPVATALSGGVNSNTRGYSLGGYSVTGSTNKIQYIQFDNETAGQLAATLVSACHLTAGINSRTKGFSCGGYSTSTATIAAEICGIAFSDETALNPAAALSIARYGSAEASSDTYGYIGSGLSAADNSLRWDRYTFASDVCASIFDTIATNVCYGTGSIGNGAFGYFGGGTSSGNLRNNILKLDMSTDTLSSMAVTISLKRDYVAGINNTQVGYFIGGTTDPSSMNYATAEIDGIDFSTETLVNPSATLGASRAGLIGVQSGGFL